VRTIATPHAEAFGLGGIERLEDVAEMRLGDAGTRRDLPDDRVEVERYELGLALLDQSERAKSPELLRSLTRWRR
jgi:hypothetical protein